MKYTVPETYQIAHNMRKYGGGFVSALGLALQLADDDNTKRIVEAFPEYMEKYLKM